MIYSFFILSSPNKYLLEKLYFIILYNIVDKNIIVIEMNNIIKLFLFQF